LNFEELKLLLPVLFFASFSQTIIGFSFGLLSLPLLFIFHYPIEKGIFIVATASFVQSLTFVIKHRDDIPIRETIFSGSLRTLFTPLGIYLLGVASELGESFLKQFVAFFLLFVLATRLVPKKKREVSQSPPLIVSLGAFSLSGIMAGMFGIGGPFLSLWSFTQNWRPNQIRCFILGSIVCSAPFLLILFYWRFGEKIGNPILLTISALPAVFLGMVLGLKLNKKIDVKLMMRISLAVIALSSLRLLLSA
jgi:uncharacterized membrane protein YfcA